jgi:hypothetical protein
MISTEWISLLMLPLHALMDLRALQYKCQASLSPSPHLMSSNAVPPPCISASRPSASNAQRESTKPLVNWFAPLTPPSSSSARGGIASPLQLVRARRYASLFVFDLSEVVLRCRGVHRVQLGCAAGGANAGLRAWLSCARRTRLRRVWVGGAWPDAGSLVLMLSQRRHQGQDTAFQHLPFGSSGLRSSRAYVPRFNISCAILTPFGEIHKSAGTANEYVAFGAGKKQRSC